MTGYGRQICWHEAGSGSSRFRSGPTVLEGGHELFPDGIERGFVTCAKSWVK